MDAPTRMDLAFAENDVIFQQSLLNVVSAENVIRQAEDNMQVALKGAYLHALSKLTDRSNYIREFLAEYLEAARKDNSVNVVRGNVKGRVFVLRGAYEPWYAKYTDMDYMGCIGEMLSGPPRPLEVADIRKASEELVLGYDTKKETWRMLSPLLVERVKMDDPHTYIDFEIEVQGESMFASRSYHSPS